MKQMFKWSEEFLTKLDDVDTQHKYLVDIINGLSEKLFEKQLSFSDLQSTFTKLLEYTVFHFSHEETLMKKHKLYHKYISEHVKDHKIFIDEITLNYNEITPEDTQNIKAKQLLNFLINWLAFHILEQDQHLAEQIFLIQKGVHAKDAYERVVLNQHNKTKPLVSALKGIMESLRHRNNELMNLKRTLELKVQERTRELVKANEYLSQISLTDQLTELPNRRYAMKTLKALWEESQIYNTDITCLMIDVDYFKQVNDGYGHDKGDEVLKKIAKQMKYSLRTDDIACRLGGDEFLVICPATNLKGGALVARTILECINKLEVKLDEFGHVYKGSISIGIASKDENTTHYEQIIKNADKSVYLSKNAGKNCIKCTQGLKL